MIKRILRVTAVAGIAVAATMGFASAAQAGALESPGVVTGNEIQTPDINIGNNACVAPWYWQGPFNVGVADIEGEYAACNGDSGSSDSGINFANDACILPWFWQGPINFLTAGQKGSYEACNG